MPKILICTTHVDKNKIKKLQVVCIEKLNRNFGSNIEELSTGPTKRSGTL